MGFWARFLGLEKKEEVKDNSQQDLLLERTVETDQQVQTPSIPADLSTQNRGREKCQCEGCGEMIYENDKSRIFNAKRYHRKCIKYIIKMGKKELFGQNGGTK